jgi:imidazole glycerol-phosphate synthase subunit HisH
MKNNLVIIDYGMGNIHSVHKKFNQMNCNVTITSDATQINAADKIILPGVGHFGKAMNNLQELNLITALNEAVLIHKKPILGICLGMQLMCKSSEEGGFDSDQHPIEKSAEVGLGWFDAHVTRIQVNDSLRYKIPHTGWNSVDFDLSNPLMKNIEKNAEFYFVHAYYVKSALRNEILTHTNYETPFVSGLFKDNIFGVQFHPEKSHDAGVQLIKNFIAL